MFSRYDYIGNFEKITDVEEMKDNQAELLSALDNLDTAITALKNITYYQNRIEELEEIKEEMDIMAEHTGEIIGERIEQEQKEYDDELKAMNYEFERSRI